MRNGQSWCFWRRFDARQVKWFVIRLYISASGWLFKELMISADDE
jgi:hypothetical protein